MAEDELHYVSRQLVHLEIEVDDVRSTRVLNIRSHAVVVTCCHAVDVAGAFDRPSLVLMAAFMYLLASVPHLMGLFHDVGE